MKSKLQCEYKAVKRNGVAKALSYPIILKRTTRRGLQTFLYEKSQRVVEGEPT
jgi:hypothetical protein